MIRIGRIEMNFSKMQFFCLNLVPSELVLLLSFKFQLKKEKTNKAVEQSVAEMGAGMADRTHRNHGRRNGTSAASRRDFYVPPPCST
jgi:hypothetical protein